MGAVHDRASRFVSFHVRKGSAQGKSDHRAHRHSGALQMTSRGAHPGRVYTDGGEMILRGFLAENFDVAFRSVGSQECVIDQAGPVARRTGLSQHESDARRARVNDAMHALRTAIETIRSATAHRRLITEFTIQTRVNYVRDLLDQLFEIAVV